jgi:hypothetical protein
MARRFHDDDYDDRPQTEESSSGKAILLVVLGVLAIIGLGGTAAVGLYFMRFEAVGQERALAVQAQAQAAAAAQVAVAQAQADAAAAEAADPFPNPNPAATEDYPADLGPERQPERQGDWTILFRSDDPAYWDTPGSAAHYAIPLFRTPPGIRFLRLKRMDNGEAVIVPVAPRQMKSLSRIGSALPGGGPPGAGGDVGGMSSSPWNGANYVEHGARHLGVVNLGNPNTATTVSVELEAFGAQPGSGFGHKRPDQNFGQRYCWKGQEIAKTVFEIAVTAGELTEDEKKLLPTTDPNP